MFGVLVAMAAAGLVFLVSVVLPIVSFARIKAAADDLRRLGDRIDSLESGLRNLERRLKDALAAQPAARPAEPFVAAIATGPAAAGTPAATPQAAAPAGAADARRLFAQPAGAGPAPAPAGPPPVMVVSAADVPIGPPAAPALPPVPGLPTAAATPAATAAPGDTLETRIGGRWLLYIGTAAFVLGIAFFVKYAFDNNWIDATGRVVLGGVVGLLMVGGGHRIARRGYPLYGQIVAGGGFAALYVSVFAALNFYSLIERPMAFGLMVLITIGAAAAAEMHRSQGLAWFAAIGGFLTPFLVGGQEDAQVVLLTYDAILAAGTMFMAARHAWPVLNLASYVLVVMTFAGWAGLHYTAEKWLRTEVFLVIFGAMFSYAGIRLRRAADDNVSVVRFILLTAPIVFHIASVANLQQQWLPLLVYLTLVSAAGVAASVKFDAAWLRLFVFAAVALPLAEWIGQHAGPGWRLAPAVVLFAIYAMNLVAIGERVSRAPDDWKKADIALLHVNALGLFAGLYVILDAFAPDWTPALALGLAVWHGVVAWSIRATSEEAGLNSLAMAFAMLGFAIGLKLDDWWAVVGWVVESAAIVWVGLRARREWMRLGGALLFAWSLFQLFLAGFFARPSGFTVLFNPRVGATLVVIAMCYALAILHRREGSHLTDKARPEIAVLWAGGNILTVLLLSTEIDFFWAVRETVDATADLARMASLSVAWAIYGTALIVVGIVRRYAPIRYLAIALLALTIGKVFLVDLSSRGGVYRIIGFIGLGAFLLLGAWLYQRYRAVILGQDEDKR